MSTLDSSNEHPSFLTADIRLALAILAEKDPSLAAEAEEAALLAGAPELLATNDVPLSTGVIAFVATLVHIPDPHRPIHIQQFLDHARRKINANPEAIHQLAEIEAKLIRLQDFDPLAHFEQLSGYKLALPGEAHDVPITKQRSRKAVAHWVKLRAVGLRLGLGLATAIIATLGLSYMSEPPLQRLANIHPDQLTDDRERTFRNLEASPADEFNRGLNSLDDSYSSFFGLFASYDANGLVTAAKAFYQAANRSDDNALRSKAWLYLGRVNLLQDDITAARTALDSAAATPSPYQEEARTLRAALSSLD